MLPEHQDIEHKKNKIAFIHVILLNKTVRFLFLIVVIAILLPTFGYVYFFSKEFNFTNNHPIKEKYIGTCAHSSFYHVPCGHKNISATNCKMRSCCYATENGCFHALPSRHQYQIKDAWIGNSAFLEPLQNVTPFRGYATQQLKVTIEEVNEQCLTISLLDPTKFQARAHKSTKQSNALYKYTTYKPAVFVEVFRKDNNKTVMFSSARGPLIFSQDFFEWSVYLNYELLFGLGRTKLEAGDKFLLFNNRNQFALPFLMAYNNHTNEYHGLKFTASGPIEVEILPSKLIMFRGMFSHQFKVDLVVGPTAQDVTRQMQKLNANTYIPPYWGWGVHFCSASKYNATLAHSDVVHLLNSSIPFDSHCIHDDLIWLTNDTIFSNETLELKVALAEKKKYFLPSFSAVLESGTSDMYQFAVNQNVLMLNTSNTPYVGEFNDRLVTYIDWFADVSKLHQLISKIWDKIEGHTFDGVTLQSSWLPDNRNVTKIPGNESASYIPDELYLSMNKSLQWNVRFSTLNSSSYFEHSNEIGATELRVMAEVVNATKFILSTSCSLEAKAVCLVQNISQSWAQLNQLVQLTVSASMAGLGLLGAPVCGDIKTILNEELCIRWYQFASLTPLFKVESDRTPLMFSGTAKQVMNNIIRRRYALLEYMNTALLTDGLLIKPFFYEYPWMVNEFESIADQFFVGNSLIASPVLFSTVSQIKLYFEEQFYEFWGGEPVPTMDVVKFTVVLSDLPLFIRAGHIVPIRWADNVMSAVESRQQPLTLVIALAASSATQCLAEGKLMPNANITFMFCADLEKITINVISRWKDKEDLCDLPHLFNDTIRDVRIYAHPEKIKQKDLAFDLCSQDWNKEILISYI